MQLQAVGQQFRSRCLSFRAKSAGLGKLCRSQGSVLVNRPEMTIRLAEDPTSWRPKVALTDLRGFPMGGGVCLQQVNLWHGGAGFIQGLSAARSGNRFMLGHLLSTGSFTVKIKAIIAALFPVFKVDGNPKVRVEDLTLSYNRTKQRSPCVNWGTLHGWFWLNKNSHTQVFKVISQDLCADLISAEDFSGGVIARVHKSYGRIFTFGRIRLPRACGYPFIGSLASGLGGLRTQK